MAQSIQSQDIKIADVFQGFYSVPNYQREYVWQTEQVEQLLTDVYTEQSDTPGAQTPEYFIGSIVVCPGENGVMDLIDGQQRMTTLFLTLCAIRDRFEKLGKSAPGALSAQIAATDTNEQGQDIFRYRLDLQYEDSGQVLVHVAEKTLDDANMNATRSTRNIADAYNCILAFLAQQFQDDVDALRVFYGYFINRVKLIRIETEDVAKALKIFETINDRGVGLDSMDLLKNLLFMRSKKSEFDSLKASWKELQDTIFNAGEKPLRFLRYFIFSEYHVSKLREDEIYGWFSRNETLCGFSKDALGFTKELVQAAKMYTLFLNGKNPSGDKRPAMDNLHLLSGKATRQYLILLLAGRHLEDSLFDRVVGEVENLLFAYVITRENMRSFERNFATWAGDVRSINSAEQLDDFFKRRLEPAKASLRSRFLEAMTRISTDGIQVYRLRYMLAKLNQHFELRAFGATESTRWLKKFIGNEYEIEHIHPQNPSPEASEEFGVVTDPALTDRLGNLVLVEKPINASLGNKPYSEKKLVYPKSKFLFVQLLSVVPKIGKNTSVDRAVKDMEPYESWTEKTIQDRQEVIAELSCRIWNFPETKSPDGSAE